jgi:hypothetical protein
MHTVQFGIGGISTKICLDNRFNVKNYDSADLISRSTTKNSGQGRALEFPILQRQRILGVMHMNFVSFYDDCALLAGGSRLVSENDLEACAAGRVNVCTNGSCSGKRGARRNRDSIQQTCVGDA